MAKRFTRNIRSIKDIEKQPKYTNEQNDLLSDDNHVYIRNKDQYEQITGGVMQVNGKDPDNKGNVDIEGGSGIKTVTNVAPDENGNVDLQLKDFGVDNATSGNLQKTTILKPDNEILPYVIDESKKGDTSEDTVNELYEKIDAHHIYEWYDKLVEKDHQKYHSYVWGYLDNGDPLKWYHFEPDTRYLTPSNSNGEHRFDAYNRYLGSKPLLFITSGVHGDEKTNIWALYLIIKDILEGKTEIDRYIKRNYEIVLLPAVNPYGLKINSRHNENDVDINRNFPFKWEGDTSDYKGSKPFSEKSTKFIKEVRDSFIENDLYYKQGMLFIDSHGYKWTNYNDDRILWVGTNNRPLRRTLLKIGGLVEKKLTYLYPDLITDDHQKFFNLGATGVGYGSTINAWNNNDGIRSFSFENVEYLKPLGIEKRFSYEGARIGYIALRDFLVYTVVEHSGGIPPSHMIGFENSLTNDNESLMNILQSIPNGRTFITGVYDSSSKFSNYMPRNADGNVYLGIFKATKSSGSTTSSGIMEFSTTNYKYVRRFYASFNSDEISDWFEIPRGIVRTKFSSLQLSTKTATIIDVFNKMNNGEIAELYITPNSSGIQSQLTGDTIVEFGSLKIIRNTSRTGLVEHTTYSKSRNRKFVNTISNGKLTKWTEILTRTEIYHTSFTNLDLKENASILDVFNSMGNGQTAELYVTGKTTGIHSQLPSSVRTTYGTIKIISNTDITGYVEFTTYSKSKNRKFVNNITQGNLAAWTEIKTESV